ncbi:DUF2029 domain-containing protein [Longispora albida]|uniref:DUF2029 domain-containing protein n=1 Tax=Longispora albida TaxID=203523 RepID=UPI0003670CC0|nr:DUF2029 domain-containing protein [Longispora albida]
MTVLTALPGPRRVLPVIAAIAAGWGVSAAAYFTGVAAILPLLVLLLAMSLVRGARTVLDQFVVAFSVLFGVTCLAGIGLSLWPWQLHPLPVAGAALTALALFAALTGRRPRLATRWRLADSLAALAAAAFAALVLRPFLGTDLAGRLGFIAKGEDFARHFIVYDSIGQIGGYTFLDPAGAERYNHPGLSLESYPQGMHFVLALLDRFWRSSGAPQADGTAAMDWLVWSYVAIFAFLGLAVIWAARRLAGFRLTAGRALLVFTVIVAWLYFGDPSGIFVRGFPNEILALGLMAIVAGLVARPLTSAGEQAVVLGTLLAAVAFTYYMFLPVAAPLVLYWLVSRRRRAWAAKGAVLTGLGLAVAGLVPIVANAKANKGSQLLLPGEIIPTSRSMTQILVLLALLGLVLAGGLRSRSRRAMLLALGAAVALVAGISGYQKIMIGQSIYYNEKAYHLLIILALAALGGMVHWLPRPSWRGRRLLPAALALVVLAAGVLVIGVRPRSARSSAVRAAQLFQGTYGAKPGGTANAIRTTRLYPDGAGKATVDLSHGDMRDFFSTLYGSVMQRDYRNGASWYTLLWEGMDPQPTIEDFDYRVTTSSRPVRFVVSDPAVTRLKASKPGEKAPTNLEAAERLAAKYPDRVEIVRLPS